MRVCASIAFLARDKEDEAPARALKDMLDLLTRLKPRRIDFRLLAEPQAVTVLLAVGLETTDGADLLKRALVRGEGEAGYRCEFLEALPPSTDWMSASARLDDALLPGGQPFDLPAPLKPGLPALFRRLRLTGAAFGYRLIVNRQQPDPEVARRLAPALAASETSGGAAAAVAAPLRRTIELLRNDGWSAAESLCLATDSDDSIAELVEEELVAGVRHAYAFLPEALIAIDWAMAEDGSDADAADWRTLVSRRRDSRYPAEAMADAMEALRDDGAAPPPPSAPHGAPSPSPASPPPQGPFAFVSYAHLERWEADRVIGALRSKGLPIWFDDHLEGGVAWDEHLEQRIRDCALLIACVSPAYEQSRYCRREIKFADLLSKPILPVAHGDYAWGPGLSLMFQELQILRLRDDEAAEVVARAAHLAPGLTSGGVH